MARDVEIAQNDHETTISGYCEVTGNLYTVVVLTKDYRRWQQGDLIQDVFPDLSADDREFLKTRITPAEWNRFVEPEEDE